MSLPFWILIGFALLLIWNLILSYLYFSSVRFYKRLRDQGTGYSLHEILDSLVKKAMKNELKLKEVTEAVRKIETSNMEDVCGVGLVRFNPFPDAGGDQSFSVAFLDRKNNGVVITSLHARSGTRVYSNPVVRGDKGNYELSEEEKKAIEEAKKSIYE